MKRIIWLMMHVFLLAAPVVSEAQSLSTTSKIAFSSNREFFLCSALESRQSGHA